MGCKSRADDVTVGSTTTNEKLGKKNSLTCFTPDNTLADYQGCKQENHLQGKHDDHRNQRHRKKTGKELLTENALS